MVTSQNLGRCQLTAGPWTDVDEWLLVTQQTQAGPARSGVTRPPLLQGVGRRTYPLRLQLPRGNPFQVPDLG